MTRPILGLASALALAVGSVACSPDIGERREGYGLQVLEVRTDTENRASVFHGGKEKAAIPVRIRVADQEINGHLSLSGQGTINKLKKSFNFVVPPDQNPGALRHRSIKLSAQAQDESMLRTLVAAQVYESLGLPVPDIQPIALYRDGDYLGLYLLIERVDGGFFDRRGSPVERIYKSKALRADFGPSMLSDPESGLEMEYGIFVPSEIRTLVEWVQRKLPDGSPPPVRDENLTSFLGANLFMINCDGFHNNYYVVRRTGDPSLEFVPWDWERAFAGDCPLHQVIPLNQINSRVLSDPDLKPKLIEVIRKLDQVSFPVQTTTALIERHAAVIERAYRADPHLGGAGLDFRTHLDELDRMQRDSRPHLRDYFQIP